ncbi:MAG: hypothetical protein J6W00_04795, partial [Lentisphaeria bacterium]|nr:hypothetical protein [Lentisphaeria bacterium]
DASLLFTLLCKQKLFTQNRRFSSHLHKKREALLIRYVLLSLVRTLSAFFSVQILYLETFVFNPGFRKKDGQYYCKEHSAGKKIFFNIITLRFWLFYVNEIFISCHKIKGVSSFIQ